MLTKLADRRIMRTTYAAEAWESPRWGIRGVDPWPAALPAGVGTGCARALGW